MGDAAQGPATELARTLATIGGLKQPLDVVAATATAHQDLETVRVVVAHSDVLATEATWAPIAEELQATNSTEAYVIRTLELDGQRTLFVAGRSMLATYFAVYDLLNTLGVDYFFDDVRVPRLTSIEIAPMHRLEQPASEMRCFKPQILGDYSRRHAFWFWDQARWEQAFRWCVQNRLNTIQLMCFAGMNWNAYSEFPEARVDNDPIMSTEARIRMAQQLIDYAHAFGLKVWIGFVTNGSTYEYVDAHPDQACTGLGGVYEGDLCGRAGRPFLVSAAREYFNTYRTADGFVFWPPEGHCHCDDCVSGRAFVDLLTTHIDYLRKHAPDKRLLLMDWSVPDDAQVPDEDLTILNMHEFSLLPPYIERGLTTLFDLIVNWDTASCTTTSPRVGDMHREMQLTHRMGVKGFEAHVVSASSGEMNIQAFAAIAWDPERFDVEAFTAGFLERYYGDTSAALRTAIRELEAVWTPPYNAYTSMFVSRFHHWAVPHDAAATCVAEITEYAELPGSPNRDLVKFHRRLPRVEMLAHLDDAVTHLARACELLATVTTDNEPIRFLTASATAQRRYAEWTAGKYRTLTALAEAQQAADAGDWRNAVKHADAANDVLAGARNALLRLKELLDANPEWFQTQPCVAKRDLEAWIGSRAVDDEIDNNYASSVIGGRCIPTAGLKTMESLVSHARAAVARNERPTLKPVEPELTPYVNYPRQREKIIAVMRQRLAQA